MKSHKVCVLGDFAVGKTSLIRRFVDQTFSEKYLTTVGVKIDTKLVAVGGEQVKLVIWDIAGLDHLDALRSSYVRGMAGYLLVCDATRRSTLTSAKNVQAEVAELIGPVPFCFLANKSDLKAEFEVDEQDLQVLQDQGWFTLWTSAKEGDNVERAFEQVAERIGGHAK